MSLPRTTPPLFFLGGPVPVAVLQQALMVLCSIRPPGQNFACWTSDFPAGSSITVPAKHDFRVNDPVVFTEEGGSLCNELTAGTQYYVATTATTISVSDWHCHHLDPTGGDTGADTPGGHIGILTRLAPSVDPVLDLASNAKVSM